MPWNPWVLSNIHLNSAWFSAWSLFFQHKVSTVIRHLLRQVLLRQYLIQQRVRVSVMIGYLVRGWVRIDVSITFNVRVHHWSNCRRSKCRTFNYNIHGGVYYLICQLSRTNYCSINSMIYISQFISWFISKTGTSLLTHTNFDIKCYGLYI